MPDAAFDSTHTDHLLEQVRDGDPAAFERLFDRERENLRRMAALRLSPGIRRRVDPSDVVQETQLEAVRRMPDYLARPGLPFRLWLRQIAYDRLLMLQRRHAGAARRTTEREVALPDEPSQQLARRLLSAESSPSLHLARVELSRRVYLALGQLSEVDREIVLMRNFEGLSNAEAAQILQLEPATSSKRYGRALLRLRTALLSNGVEETRS